MSLVCLSVNRWQHKSSVLPSTNSMATLEVVSFDITFSFSRKPINPWTKTNPPPHNSNILPTYLPYFFSDCYRWQTLFSRPKQDGCDREKCSLLQNHVMDSLIPVKYLWYAESIQCIEQYLISLHVETLLLPPEASCALCLGSLQNPLWNDLLITQNTPGYPHERVSAPNQAVEGVSRVYNNLYPLPYPMVLSRCGALWTHSCFKTYSRFSWNCRLVRW